MIYTLTYYHNGTPSIEYFKAKPNSGTLVSRVKEHLATVTDNPDVPFSLTDRQGHVILTEEDLN